MTARRKRPVTLRPLCRVSNRDAAWAVLRELGADGRGFTVADLSAHIVIGVDMIRAYLASLASAGFLSVTPPATIGRPAIYRLIRDVGVEAPRVTGAGVIDDTPSDQERIWQAVKVLPSFDARDVMASTGITAPTTVRSYILMLARAGYLAVVQPATTRSLARYRLLPSRNTGPRPPAIRRGKVVFDPNLGRQVWPVVTP